MYEIKTENVSDDFSKNKEMFDFSSYSVKSKYYDDSNALVVSKMKDEMSGVATEKILILKLKMYLILVSDFSAYKKAKGVNKNVFAKISHNEYADVLLKKMFKTFNE